jgi:hypothetical protein
MTIRCIVIATIAAASFSTATPAAPVATAALIDSKSTFTLVMTGGNKYRGHRRHRYHRERDRDPFCMFSLAARLSGICDKWYPPQRNHRN